MAEYMISCSLESVTGLEANNLVVFRDMQFLGFRGGRI